MRPLDPTFAASIRFQNLMYSALTNIFTEYFTHYNMGRITVRKNNRRSLAEVGTTTISYNITARSDLSQNIQNTLNNVLFNGLFPGYLNYLYSSDDSNRYGFISLAYGTVSTTNIQVRFPVRGPTLRPTMGPTSRPAGDQACDIIS